MIMIIQHLHEYDNMILYSIHEFAICATLLYYTNTAVPMQTVLGE